jgi:hypothetical protein
VRQLERGLLTESGERGEFLLEGVAAGASWLVAEKGERSPNTRVVVEPDGAADEVVLVLGEPARSGQVVVRVTLPGGGPAAGALVFLETAEGAQHLGTADGQGLATFELTPPYPGQLRAGAFAAGRLGLGDLLPFAEEMESLELPLEASGAALRLLAKSRTRPAIETRGWNLSWWLGRLGRLPIAEADRELAIEGLPPGPYRGQLGDQAFAVVLSPGESALVEEKR